MGKETTAGGLDRKLVQQLPQIHKYFATKYELVMSTWYTSEQTD